MSTATENQFKLRKTLYLPAPVTCLASGPSNQLLAGSNDGTLRVYDLNTLKVSKAIRGFNSEVSSVVVKTTDTDVTDIWVACGQQALSFTLKPDKTMILNASDAIQALNTCRTDDVLNELSLNSSQSHLAFSSDDGIVGVVELDSLKVTRMKRKHQSICGSVKFIPDRPSELVSAGYDHIILHHNFQGTNLSHLEIPPIPSLSGPSLSPPFIMCTAISSSGVIAAGTADGRCFLGVGGEKSPTSKSRKKRARKWNGLEEGSGLLEKVAEGPVVAMQFTDSERLTTSSLLGNVTHFRCVIDDNGVTLEAKWKGKTKDVEKVNALVVDSNRIIIGGLTLQGKGVIEIWYLDV